MAEHCSIFITRYRAVLFDMDGVITDTMPLHLKAWQEAFRPCGFPWIRWTSTCGKACSPGSMAREIVREKGASISDGDLDEIVAEKTRIFDREARSRQGVRRRARDIDDAPEQRPADRAGHREQGRLGGKGAGSRRRPGAFRRDRYRRRYEKGKARARTLISKALKRPD